MFFYTPENYGWVTGFYRKNELLKIYNFLLLKTIQNNLPRKICASNAVFQ
jgi:hypothetical protein